MPQPNNTNNVIKIISGSKGHYPIKLGIIANKLAVSIYLHNMVVAGKSVPCWSYVSDGLISLKQKETIFTLQARDGEDTRQFPTQPLQLFVLIYKSAAQQKLVSAGDVLPLGEKGLYSFPAMALVPPVVDIPNVTFSRPMLSVILLTKEELVVAQSFGLTRVISRLGYEQKRFPCHGANARGRRSVNWQAVVQKSVIKNVPRTPVKQASVYLFGGDQVVLNLPAALRMAMGNAFKKHPPNKPISLLMALNPSHEGCLVWLADSGATEMHMKPAATGESIDGSFILLEPGQMNDGAAILEDGFSMQFTPPNWALFVNAIAAGQYCHISGNDGAMDFIVTWGDQPVLTGAESRDESHTGAGNIFKKLLSKFKK